MEKENKTNEIVKSKEEKEEDKNHYDYSSDFSDRESLSSYRRDGSYYRYPG